MGIRSGEMEVGVGVRLRQKETVAGEMGMERPIWSTGLSGSGIRQESKLDWGFKALSAKVSLMHWVAYTEVTSRVMWT